MKARLMHDVPAILAVPPQCIDTVFRSLLLNDDSQRIRKSYRVVRYVCRQQKHLSLTNRHISKRRGVRRRVGSPRIDGLQQHAAFVLVEPFRRAVDVVVCARIGSADNLVVRVSPWTRVVAERVDDVP